jgi:hypothetical protein
MSINVLTSAPADILAARVKRLRDEAQAHARDHAEILVRSLTDVEAIAADIARGGEAYPVGVREAARLLGPEIESARLQLATILARAA